jgi:hypothetical protein
MKQALITGTIGQDGSFLAQFLPSKGATDQLMNVDVIIEGLGQSFLLFSP